MGFIDDLAQQTGSQLSGGLVGMGMGMATAGWQDQRQRRQAEKLQEIQIKGMKDMGEFNYGKQMQYWNETNAGAQMKHLKAAGLNPALMYGGGGAGGSTGGVGGASPSGSSAAGGSGEIGEMMGLQMQRELLKAQKENIEADTENKKAVTEKTSGVDTDNVKAETANKVLDGIILQYTGKEAKDQYERIKAPNRGIEEKTYMHELEARQGIAQNIYELYSEGLLKDKSVAEVEELLLKNAKTREETRKIYKDMELLEQNIKGAKLDNIIKDLETKLQMETGIDSKSPTWLKVLGRLFVNLMGK